MKYHYTATVKNVHVLNRQTYILTVQPNTIRWEVPPPPATANAGYATEHYQFLVGKYEIHMKTMSKNHENSPFGRHFARCPRLPYPRGWSASRISCHEEFMRFFRAGTLKSNTSCQFASTSSGQEDFKVCDWPLKLVSGGQSQTLKSCWSIKTSCSWLIT